ncbi:ABC transporter substrate-binding protein [Nocardioides sp. LHD-245]|uniref:ABC transporter substrate-binding protein n=1 Tax=Nocardioides sp. LHD-245 TaxID=3051387 RepID=UPI0027DF10BC|nr:ABC transporter substrate-binding protein [Nocardioides sp. LHD-245]
MRVRTRKNRALAASAVVLGLVLAATGCSGGPGDDKDSITVAMGHEAPYPGEEAILYAVPKQLGLFDDYGIDVSYMPTSGSSVAVQLVQAGKADLGQGNPSSVMAAINKGVDIKIVYNLIPEYGSGLAVLEDSAIQSPEDLAGKTVGVASLSSSRLPEAKAMAEEAGVGDDVEFVAVGIGAQAANALSSGKVDGLYLWDAAYQAIELSGTDLRVMDDVFSEAGMLLDFVEYASTDAIKEKSDALEKLGRAGAVAQEWAKQNPEKALDMFYAEFPNAKSDDAGRARDLEILKATIAQYDPANAGQEDYGYTPEDRAEATAAFLAKYDLIPEALPVADYVDNSLVSAYNDFTAEDVSAAGTSK